MPATVGEVAAELIRHPLHNLVLRWNWKSALLSPLVRGSVIFAANAGAGSAGAVSALGVEVTYRALIGGVCGTIVESFRVVEPYWAGQLTVLVVVPAISDAVDIFIHHAHRTPNLGWSALASVAWTTVSTAFNYFAMRRGAFIVGSGRRSVFHDLAMIPPLMIGFLKLAVRQVQSARNPK